MNSMNTYLALDKKIAIQFHTSAQQTEEYPHDLGEMRKLRIELQSLCGITEIEAMNVLIYRNVSDYISKYSRAIAITNPAIPASSGEGAKHCISDKTIMPEAKDPEPVPKPIALPD